MVLSTLGKDNDTGTKSTKTTPGSAITGSSLSTSGNLSVNGKVATSLKPDLYVTVDLGGTGTNERWNVVYASSIDVSGNATVGSLSSTDTKTSGTFTSTGYNYGTSGVTLGGKTYTGEVGCGIYTNANDNGTSSAGSTNFGIYAYASGKGYSASKKSTNYAIYAKASANNANNWAGYFEGAVGISGPLSVSSAETTSLTVTNTSSSNYTNGISASASYGYRVSTGVSGIANSATGTNIGVYGEADEQRSDGTHYGVKGYANGASENYAIYGEVEESNYSTNYAVWAEGPAGGTTSWWNSSDARLKKDVQTLNGALDKVLKLRGVTYYWKSNEERGDSLNLHLDNKKHIGVIAQELEQEFPELVNTGRGGYKTVEYATLAPILIEAVKEQQSIIESQQQRIEKLEKLLEELLKKQ